MIRTNEKHTRSMRTELRAKPDTDKKVIEGYFAVFDSPTELWAGAFEKISRNAFDNTISGDIRALTNHDTSLVLGRTKAGTLKLSVDSHGLYGEITVNENDTDAMNLYERVKRGDVDQCSFGFYILKESTDWRDDGSVIWTLEEVELFEVSCCTFPAYKDTGIQAREQQVEQYKNKQLQYWQQSMKERIQNVKSTDA
ncbi:HK97 family phage prohead protease [Microaceticoccus formicicus]|uniref:HK97 family phage prohead protease n=1 Tax=Microaceticoccus formicicus TaxID=3118105 RepID=UPI003CD00C41|nr:HK97 family phage prohead protease [Peptoniphilaceae bacterium AMB_02]